MRLFLSSERCCLSKSMAYARCSSCTASCRLRAPTWWFAPLGTNGACHDENEWSGQVGRLRGHTYRDNARRLASMTRGSGCTSTGIISSELIFAFLRPLRISSMPSSSSSRAPIAVCSTVSRCTREEVETILEHRNVYSQFEAPQNSHGAGGCIYRWTYDEESSLSLRSCWSCSSLADISAMGFGFGFGITLKPSGVVFLARVGEVGDCGLLALVGPIL